MSNYPRFLRFGLFTPLSTAYETKVLNQAVTRNISRFPERFRFQLTKDEYENLRSQIVTSSLDDENAIHGGRRHYTLNNNMLTNADINSFNAQYPTLNIKYTKKIP